MLYTLAFAFTTGTHVYGDREKRGKQLETGRHVTFLLGGIDRPDRVGQATLGLWYERKLEGECMWAGGVTVRVSPVSPVGLQKCHCRDECHCHLVHNLADGVTIRERV
jgi:hypothetical protein